MNLFGEQGNDNDYFLHFTTGSKESRDKLLDLINEKLKESGVTNVPEDDILDLAVYAKDSKTGKYVVDIARTLQALKDKYLNDSGLNRKSKQKTGPTPGDLNEGEVFYTGDAGFDYNSPTSPQRIDHSQEAGVRVSK